MAPFVWRWVWDFGNGTMPDMSPHHFDPAFNALGLDAPDTIEARTSFADPDVSIGTFFGTFDFTTPVDLGGHDASSWVGGVQVGCDYQVPGTGFVFGIQADYDWTDANASHVDPVTLLTTLDSRTKSLASVTGSIGYAWDRFLGYVKGGGAWERDEYAITTATSVGAAAETRRGWTIGVGGEYAFTNSLSGFAEYNYYDFGSRDLTFTTTPLGSFIANIKETKSVARAGLNVRFGGWAAPAAAK